MIFTYTKEFLVPQGLYFDIRSFCNVLEMLTFFINVILEPHCAHVFRCAQGPLTLPVPGLRLPGQSIFDLVCGYPFVSLAPSLRVGLGPFSLLQRVQCPGDFLTRLWLPIAITVALAPCRLVPTRCVCCPLPILFLGQDEWSSSPCAGPLPDDLCCMGPSTVGALHIADGSLSCLHGP